MLKRRTVCIKSANKEGFRNLVTYGFHSSAAYHITTTQWFHKNYHLVFLSNCYGTLQSFRTQVTRVSHASNCYLAASCTIFDITNQYANACNSFFDKRFVSQVCLSSKSNTCVYEIYCTIGLILAWHTFSHLHNTLHNTPY